MNVLIFANGDPPQADTARRYAEWSDLVIGADGGARHALAIGLAPHVIIGDLDSLGEQEQAQLATADCQFVRHPPAKDETDLELALRYAADQDASHIVILGALGGRLDQSIANVLLLNLPTLRGRTVYLVDGPQSAFVIHGQATIQGKIGDTLSLIPLAGAANGVTTDGLAYPLNNGVLPFGPALGVSNQMTAATAHVQVRDGLLLCIHIQSEEE